MQVWSALAAGLLPLVYLGRFQLDFDFMETVTIY